MAPESISKALGPETSGAVVSILKGPIWAVDVQLPTTSAVLRLNHQTPSTSGALVVVETLADVLSACGVSVVFALQVIEKPSTPDAVSVAPEIFTSIVLSFVGVTVVFGLDKLGSLGSVVSTLITAEFGGVSVLSAISADQ